MSVKCEWGPGSGQPRVSVSVSQPCAAGGAGEQGALCSDGYIFSNVNIPSNNLGVDKKGPMAVILDEGMVMGNDKHYVQLHHK